MADWEPVPEAPLERGEAGTRPAGPGWFIVNVADADGTESERFGASARFENRQAAPFPEFAINIRRLEPGQPASLYHREGVQEAFLVLGGECVAIVEETERRMRKGDFLYTPRGTAHVLIGAGDGPCSILMVGTRADPERVLYPVSEAAARYGASASAETSDPRAAYGENPLEPRTLGLPW